MAQLEVHYTVDFGNSVRIGYRTFGSTGPYTYVMPFPDYSQTPYYVTGIPAGDYEVEVTSVCPNCAGSSYGQPVVTHAVIM